jgi:ketohexokinase
MSRILTTGIATLDIINQVDHYPAEDEELRAEVQSIRCGGNATNTACVLAQFGFEVHLLATLGEDNAAEQIRRQLQANAVVTERLVTIPQGRTPTSYITLNRANASRTIIHYRDLPELEENDFPFGELEDYDWFHFEGRNIDTLEKILRRLVRQRVDQPISIEIEKPRPGIERLYRYADLLLFSRAFAKSHDYTCADTLFDDLRSKGVSATLVCSWAEQGAFACDRNGRRYHSPAFVPDQVVDTLGAGDTFHAGLIRAMLEGSSLETALHSACELAGRKVAQYGLANLGT